MEKVVATFNQLNIVSSNLEASLAFYRRLGVEIPEDLVWRTKTGAHHASAQSEPEEGMFDLDFDSAAFAPHWNAGWNGRGDLGGRVVVGFHVPSREAVDELYRDMTGAGHPGLQAPWDAFWGARYAIVEDPDGIAVGIMSPASPAHRSKPPEV